MKELQGKVGTIEDYKIVFGREHQTGFVWGAYLANPMTVMLMNHDVSPGLYDSVLNDSWETVWHPTYTDPEISNAVAKLIHQKYTELYEDARGMREEVRVFYDKIIPRMILFFEEDKHLGALKLRYPYTLTVLGKPKPGVFPVLTIDPRADDEEVLNAGNECLRYLEHQYGCNETLDSENMKTSIDYFENYFPEYVSEYINPLMQELSDKYINIEGPLDEYKSNELFNRAFSEIDDLGLEVVHRCLQFVFDKKLKTLT